MSTFNSCTVACVGRALTKDYRLPEEALRRAHETGEFWKKHRYKIRYIACIGGYPKSMLLMAKPPNNICEGGLLHDILVNDFQIPTACIKVEGESTNTFYNFSNSLKLGVLQFGAYSAKHPLVLSVSTTNSWRLGLFARRSLAIPVGGLLRLKPGNLMPENSQQQQLRERDLTVVAQLAMDNVEACGIKPTSNSSAIAFMIKSYVEFRKLWRDFEAGKLGSYKKFMRDHDYTWPLPDIPVVKY